MNMESPYGGGVSSLPGATGSLLPVKFPAAPVLLADGPQLGSWQVAVVRVDETPAGDVSGRECPRAEQNWQRPLDVFEVTGNVRPVVRLGALPWLVQYTLPAQMAPLLQVAPLAHVRGRLQVLKKSRSR